MVDLALLSSKILLVKGKLETLKQKFVGPFRVEENIGSRDVRGKEREKTGTGKKLERTRFFPFPFLQILTSAHL